MRAPMIVPIAQPMPWTTGALFRRTPGSGSSSIAQSIPKSATAASKHDWLHHVAAYAKFRRASCASTMTLGAK